MLRDRGSADATVDLANRAPNRVLSRLTAAFRLTRVAWRLRHQLCAIHANGLAELNLAVLPALVARCRLVVWAHEWEPSRWSRRIAPLIRALAPTIRYAAVSEQSRGVLIDSGVALPPRTTVVANPIDPADVRWGGARPDYRDRPLRAAYLGTPAAYKGFHLLPAIIESTQADRVTWTVFAGPETLMPSTFAELRALGVSLPGKTLDVRQAYGCADVVVVPSLRESFGRVAAEAMANGLPVVASDLAALREVLGDGEAGLLVPPGDVGAFAEALRRLAKDPELCGRLGRAGLARSGRFDPERVVGRLADLYGLPARAVS